MPILGYCGKKPRIHKSAFVSQSATIIGDVEIAEGTSIWPGTVIRGDVAKVTIGKYSNLQENVVVHGGDLYEGDTLKGHIPVSIGDYVTIAHSAVVHGCNIEDVTLVGIQATIYDGSRIGEGSIIGIGAVVLENTRVPPRSVVVGVPGRVIKKVDEATFTKIKKQALLYNKLAESHGGDLFKHSL